MPPNDLKLMELYVDAFKKLFNRIVDGLIAINDILGDSPVRKQYLYYTRKC